MSYITTQTCQVLINTRNKSSPTMTTHFPLRGVTTWSPPWPLSSECSQPADACALRAITCDKSVTGFNSFQAPNGVVYNGGGMVVVKGDDARLLPAQRRPYLMPAIYNGGCCGLHVGVMEIR